MNDSTPDLPLCECGCGERVALGKITNRRLGLKAGTPNRFVHGHKAPKKWEWDLEDRGYETPCWIWRGHIDTKGYGRINTMELAHRAVWKRDVGDLSPDVHLHHRCEQHDCVRPDHCEPKTASDHLRDHQLKRSSMTPEKARLIREASGSQREIARCFGISQGFVWAIKHGLAWPDS